MQGITTTRDLASRGTLAMTLRDSIARGELMGPRLQATGAPITVPGGNAYSMGGVAQGVEAVRALVWKRAAEGADLIKL
jgi:imidazolonepropionase-like amidohydrolase